MPQLITRLLEKTVVHRILARNRRAMSKIRMASVELVRSKNQIISLSASDVTIGLRQVNDAWQMVISMRGESRGEIS